MSEIGDLELNGGHRSCPSDVTPGGPHQWQPVSMVFESQLLDGEGRVLIRQPDIEQGRVYLVCVNCAQHTYMSTSWSGFRLYGSEDRPKFSRTPAPRPQEKP